jgi:VCBS repeat-containing protein
MATLLGSNSSDSFSGSAEADKINAGAGDDLVDGGAGNDVIDGGVGNDTLDGGSGSDVVKGGAGNDTAIYNVTENLGSTDDYQGGSGVDTILIEFTGAQWSSQGVQSDVERYKAFLATHSSQGEVGQKFQFSAFNLQVQQFEILRVTVDGWEVDLYGNDAPQVRAANTSCAVVERADGAEDENVAVLTRTGDITFVDFDPSDQHTVSVSAHGTSYLGSLTTELRETQPADGSHTVTWSFTVKDGEIDHLGDGESRIQTYTIVIDDGHGGSISKDVIVTLTGTNDAPVLTVDTSGGVAEDVGVEGGQLSDSGSLSFSDADLNDQVTITSAYNGDAAWSGGALTEAQVAALSAGFSADGSGWSYSVANAALDFLGAGETVTLTFTVTATDDSGAGNASASQIVTLTLTGTNDAPVINSNGGGATASVTVQENTTSVTLVQASDPDSSSVTYSIVGGADASKFTINSATGALSFITAPTFEAPADSDLNNTYEVTVRASDGTAFDEQAITVTVANANEAPSQVAFAFDPSILNGSSIDTNDALLANRVIGSFSAVDPDAGTTLTYSLGAGSAAGFTLTSGGILSTGGVNVASGTYTLTIVASDGALTSSTTVKVSVGTNGSDTLTLGNDLNIAFGLGQGDTINGGTGSDAIAGGQQADTLTGGSGNDALIGGTQNDRITGGAGADLLVGGGNNDVFVFTTASDSTTTLLTNGVRQHDLIVDFNANNDDFDVAGAVSSVANTAIVAGGASGLAVGATLDQVLAFLTGSARAGNMTAGQAEAYQISGLANTALNGTWVFVDSDADAHWTPGTDLLVQLQTPVTINTSDFT